MNDFLSLYICLYVGVILKGKKNDGREVKNDGTNEETLIVERSYTILYIVACFDIINGLIDESG